MTVIPTLFRKLQTVKGLVRPFCKKHRVRTLFDSQHVKVSQILVKHAWEYFHLVFCSVWENLIWKISPLGLLGNIMTANDKYPFQDCENLYTPVEMHLSSKLKSFPNFFVPFLETTLNFEYFQKKYVCHSYFILESTDCQRLG